MSLIMKSLMSQKPISICEPEENRYIKDIEKLIKKKIQIVSDNPFPQTDKPMNNAEKKAFEKEKQKRKQEFFANRKKTTIPKDLVLEGIEVNYIKLLPHINNDS